MTFLVLTTIAIVDSDGRSSVVDDAISAYQSAMKSTDRQQRLNGFRRSELLFQKAIDELGHPANSALFTNLGNASLSGERLGPAIVAYRKALLLNPYDDRAKNNLQYARSLLPEWVRNNPQTSILDQLPVSPRDTGKLSTAAAACFVVACLLFVLAVRWQVGVLKLLSALPLLSWAALLVVSVAFSSPASIEAVVVRDEVTARSADSHHASARFDRMIPNGTEVVILDKRDSWLQVSIAAETAWVPSSAVELISLEPKR